MAKTITWKYGARFNGDPEAVHKELTKLSFIPKVSEKIEYLREHKKDFPALWACLPVDEEKALFDLQVHTLHMVYEAITIEIVPYKTKQDTFTVRAFPSNPKGAGYIEIDQIQDADERHIYLSSIEQRIESLKRELSDARSYFKVKGYSFPQEYLALEAAIV